MINTTAEFLNRLKLISKTAFKTEVEKALFMDELKAYAGNGKVVTAQYLDKYAEDHDKTPVMRPLVNLSEIPNELQKILESPTGQAFPAKNVIPLMKELEKMQGSLTRPKFAELFQLFKENESTAIINLEDLEEETEILLTNPDVQDPGLSIQDYLAKLSQ